MSFILIGHGPSTIVYLLYIPSDFSPGGSIFELPVIGLKGVVTVVVSFVEVVAVVVT